MMTCEMPSDETERSSSIPLIVLTAFLDLVGDLGLDLLGRGARLHGRDHDGREVDLRKAIDAEPGEREDADHGQRQDEHASRRPDV